MTTKLDEISAGIYRISTFVPEIAPSGLTFNQFLLVDDEPLLFHTGHRSMFGPVREAVERVTPLERLRWIAFGHVESDECGAMNEFLGAASHAEIAHGGLGCMVSIAEMADCPPRPLTDGEVLELGSKRVRHIDTPHVPHAWEARVLYEETSRTLLCGDLFTHLGDGPALIDDDIVGPASVAEDLFGYSCLAPSSASTVERLADLEPEVLALMHGSSFNGDCSGSLRALAGDYRRRIEQAA